MHVLHVVPAAPGGGTAGYTQRQIDALARLGVEGRTVTFAGSSLLARPHRVPAAIQAIRGAIREARPEVVHAHWGSLLGLAAALATLTVRPRVPLLVSYRGSDINPVPSEARLRSAVRVICSQAAAVVAAGVICMSDELRRRIGWSPARERARVIPDGTDIERFQPVPRDEARRKLGWPLDERIVLFNANNPAVKRLDLAEAAMHTAEETVGPVRLVVMRGDVPYDQVPLWMNASDCVLLTSDYEGSPSLVREALACNVPVVSVRVGDVERWLDGGRGQRIVKRDPRAIGAAIAETVRTPFRSDGRRHAEEFSEDATTAAVLDVYRALLRGR